MTVSIENYVKAIYTQSNLLGSDAKLGTVARLLNISNAAATDMARKLSAKNLVNYTKYQPLTLTKEGNKLALNVIRKHRLWESFLFKTLNLSLHEIHREAEHLEHLTSDFLANKMDDFLGNPSIDPHGDPIPAYNGTLITDEAQIVLSEARAGYEYKISRLQSSEKDFFDFCASNNMAIGSNLRVEKQYGSKKMTEILVDQNRILLNEEFTKIIYVKRV